MPQKGEQNSFQTTISKDEGAKEGEVCTPTALQTPDSLGTCSTEARGFGKRSRPVCIYRARCDGQVSLETERYLLHVRCKGLGSNFQRGSATLPPWATLALRPISLVAKKAPSLLGALVRLHIAALCKLRYAICDTQPAARARLCTMRCVPSLAQWPE